MNDVFSLSLTTTEILLRIFISILIGGAIGYERGIHNRIAPAGFRTHILVCLGACIVSIIQDQLRVNTTNFAIAYPDVAQVIKTDLGRIGAQVVSGIGFLGAGTIMRDKGGAINGLTTAASIWATGCLGLSIGWGFYSLAVPSGIAIIIVLVTLKKFEESVINKRCVAQLEICFSPDSALGNNSIKIYDSLKNKNIKIKNMEKNEESKKLLFSIVIPKQFNPFDLLSEISRSEEVTKVSFK